MAWLHDITCPNPTVAEPVAVENMWQCNALLLEGYGGAWEGHVLPGMLFIVWSLHWMQGSMRAYFSARARGLPFTSKTHYTLPGTPAWPLESFFVVGLAGMGAYLELTHHSEGYARLYCSSESERAGRFDGTHMNNWQHAVMYFCFITAALVTICAYYLDLPAGIDKMYFSLAFLGEGMLMGLHEKHDPLNQIVHQTLAITMLFASAAAAAEAIWPHSYLVTCTKIAMVQWQGVMFCLIAQLIFCGGTAWDQATTDQAPAEYAAVAMIQALCGVLGAYLAVFLVCNAFSEKAASLKDAEGV